ncbi:MAG: heparinase II/III family protein, partial [Candidatus Latescibacteria bacterium]|nr:heparinase II/III family protein [Candidatus Latescibacterota bacterium]
MKMMLCCLYVLYSVSSVFASDYEPYVYRQDFETRELMAWSSYPPVQDAAYEAPYIYPGTIVPGEEGTVLCKIIYPQWNVPQLTGIVKRLNIRLDNESHISFRYYIKTSLEPSWIGIDLPMLDGDRIRSRFMKPLTNKWVTVDFGLKEIFDAAGRIKTDHLDITAFAITVRFEHADPDMPIAIGFDDFLVSGQREATFRYEQPRTVSLEEWDSDIAMKHYRYGDELIIKGMFPYSNPDIITAQIVRFDRPEHTIRTVPMKKDGGSWVTIKSVKIDAKTFPAGMYEVRLTGTKKNEPVARSSFSFMVLDDAMYSEHPRFWFNSQNKHDFITRLKSDKYKPFLEKIRLEAQDARERLSVNLPYDLDTFPTKGWLSSFEPYRTRIATIPQRALTNAIVYTVDGDSEAGEWAKKAMVSLCQWPSWNHPWMRNRGHHIYLYQYYTTYNLALTYDILYDLLTETEREIVRKAMIRNGLKPAYRTYVVADMCTCNESNWITAIAGGAIAGACAILGETDNTDQFEPYLSGCLYKIKAHMNTVYGGDSSCLEGFGYGYGTMWIYSEVLPFLKNSLNIDMSPWLDRQYTEGFWAADHNAGMYFTFGDARISLPDMAFCPWLIDKFRDPELAWFYDLNPPAPAFTSYHTVLFDIDNIPRKPPENLTGAKWFKSTGTVVFRSGPGPEPFVLTFRCGPFGNHQHIDQGTFFLADRGELFITEQEYSDYYEDPIYQSHIIQPVGHNCILINHNPQSQRTGDHEKYATGMSDFARITDFVSDESMAFALGDLSPVYLGNVKKLQRGILYLHPRTAIIIDRFETKSGEATMDVLFHGPKYSDIRDLDGKFEISSGKTSLYGFPMGISSPSKYTITPDPVKLANYTDDPVEPMGRVTVTTGTTGGKAVSALLFGEQKTVDSGDGSAFFTPDDTYVVINGSETELYDYGICTDGLCVVMTKNGSLLLVDG